MAQIPIVQHAIIAGEITPRALGRDDLERYGLGVKRAQNFIVDYRGGGNFRFGTEFVNLFQTDTKPIRIENFKYSVEGANSYILVFGDQTVRFVQDGGYVLEPDIGILNISTGTTTTIPPGVAHGLSVGDLINLSGISGTTQLNSRLAIVGVIPTATSIEINDFTGTVFDTSAYSAYVSGGTINRVYTLTSPYLAEDLETLQFFQDRNTVSIVSLKYPDYDLVRTDHTNWTISIVNRGTTAEQPSNVALSASGSASAGTTVSVTSVNLDGEESLPSIPVSIENAVNYTTTAGSLSVTWDEIEDAQFYKVYRSQVYNNGSALTHGDDRGFIGKAFGRKFTDSNIIPDFTHTPPVHFDPFANSQIVRVFVTAGGSGYSKTATLTVTDSTGSGFVGFPIIDNSGAVISIFIVNPGKDYTAPVFTISGGTGATVDYTLSAASGNYPGTVAKFQQRRVYGGTANTPLTLYGTRPRQPRNMDISVDVNEADAFIHEMDTQEVSPILSLTITNRGLLIFTRAGIFELNGYDQKAVTALSAAIDPQNFTGVSDLPPLQIGDNVVFTAFQGNNVYSLSYNSTTRSYGLTDLSVLSSHLVTRGREIIDWGYSGEPFKTIWAPRKDGKLLVHTYVPEENVNGFSVCSTKGLYKNVAISIEDKIDTPYFIIERFLQGRWTKCLERQKIIEPEFVEDSWCLDCALELPQTRPAANLIASASTGTATITADAPVFKSGDAGKVLRMGGGKGVVTSFLTTLAVNVEWIREPTEILPEDANRIPMPVLAGDWTYDRPITSVSGLWHLEGETVQIVMDGNREADAVVAQGTVSWENPATRGIVGLPYKGILETLPASTLDTVITDLEKRPVYVSFRQYQSKGLKIGTSENNAKPIKQRTDEEWGEPTRLTSSRYKELVESVPDLDGSIVFLQDEPFPASVIGFIINMDVKNVTSR